MQRFVFRIFQNLLNTSFNPTIKQMLELNDLRPRRGGKVDNYIDAVEDFENEKMHKINAFEKQKKTHLIFVLIALFVGLWMLFWIVTNYDVSSAIMKKPNPPRSQKEIEMQQQEEFQIEQEEKERERKKLYEAAQFVRNKVKLPESKLNPTTTTTTTTTQPPPQKEQQKMNVENDDEPRPIKADPEKQKRVKEMFLHAFGGYEKFAFGFDEVRPVSNETNSSWGAFGVTIFDALDTMVIMGLKEEYDKSVEHVLGINFEKDHEASFFEFTIRYVGGLLGAFELTRDKRLLDKAAQMADKLMNAFNDESGYPKSIVNLKSGKARNPSWTAGRSILAEVGSFQIEFQYLSHHTQNPKYRKAAEQAMLKFSEVETFEGLFPVYLGNSGSDSRVSYGGLGDSFYEYLLKQYVLSNQSYELARDLYLSSTEGMIKNMIVTSRKTNLKFLTEFSLDSKEMIMDMDHLACFAPGMLALGSTVFPDIGKAHLKLAESLAEGCYYTYAQQPTKIGPERIKIKPNDKENDIEVLSGKYLLRPETIESLFVLYRTTRKEKYRTWGWNIFKAIEQHCKTPTAYSGLKDVRETNDEKNWNNSMQSFFFAETLKYLYLLFSDPDVIALDRYVFNTEAHPLGVIFESQ